MGILRYILFLGIINLVFGFLWKWVVLVPTSLIFGLFRFDKGAFIVKLIGSYLLVSLTAALSLVATLDKGLVFTILIFFIGGFILFLGFSTNSQETRQQARIDQNFNLYKFQYQI